MVVSTWCAQVVQCKTRVSNDIESPSLRPAFTVFMRGFSDGCAAPMQARPHYYWLFRGKRHGSRAWSYQCYTTLGHALANAMTIMPCTQCHTSLAHAPASPMDQGRRYHSNISTSGHGHTSIHESCSVSSGSQQQASDIQAKQNRTKPCMSMQGTWLTFLAAFSCKAPPSLTS